MNNEFYFKALGSLTEHLLMQNDISNEDMIGIILDFKVAWKLSEEAGYTCGEVIFSIMSEMMSEDDTFFIVSPWIIDTFFHTDEDIILYN